MAEKEALKRNANIDTINILHSQTTVVWIETTYKEYVPVVYSK